MAWRPDAVKARSVAYDRLRGELAMSTSLSTMSSVVTGAEPSATLPATRIQESEFNDTHPVEASGFHATRPVVYDPSKSSASSSPGKN
jgi:hypothetical protein